MTKKTKFTLLLSASFLAAVGILTIIFIVILQNDHLSKTTEVDPSAIQSFYGNLSSGDLLSLILVLIFIAMFIYYIFKA